MKLTKNEIMNILNGGGEMKVTLSHEEKLEVVRRFELHGMIEEPKFAIAIPDKEDQDGYAVYDRAHGWLAGYEKNEIAKTKSYDYITRIRESDLKELPYWAQELAKEVQYGTE